MRSNFSQLSKKNLVSCQNPKKFPNHKNEMKDCSHCKRQVPKLYHKCCSNESNSPNQNNILILNNNSNRYDNSSFFRNQISYFKQDRNDLFHFVQHFHNFFPYNVKDINNYSSSENEFCFELYKLYDCYCEFDTKEKTKKKRKKRMKRNKKMKGKKNKKDEDESIENEKNEKLTEEKFLEEFKGRLLKRKYKIYDLFNLLEY